MNVPKGSLSSIRNVNRASILHLVRLYGPLSRASLAKHLGMSRSAVSNIVDELISEGLIRETGVGTSTLQGGRRPVNLSLVPTARYALGIDMGGTKTLTVLTDLDGHVVARRKFPSKQAGMSPLQNVLMQTRTFLADSRVPTDKVVGAGIAAPGITDPASGVLLESPGLRLKNVNLRDWFAESLPFPVCVENDVNMAALGEQWRGAGVNFRNLVMIAIGTGVGAGIVLNNQLYRGGGGFAGEIGYLQLDPFAAHPSVSLEEFGPLERMTSGVGISDVARAMLPKYPDSALQFVDITSETVFSCASEGDALAMTVINRVVHYLAFSVANIVTLLNPDAVILGGGVSQAGDAFISRIRTRVNDLTPVPCRVVPAGLGEDASAVGGAAAALMESGYLLRF